MFYGQSAARRHGSNNLNEAYADKNQTRSNVNVIETGFGVEMDRFQW